MPNLQTTISNLTLQNPTILASGIMDEDAGSMKRIMKNGAGAIVTKSIGIKPRAGYPNPTLIELETGILNAMGLPNAGIKHFKEEMNQLQHLQTPIIGSIYASNPNDFITLAQQMQEYKAAALELNLSCPHAKQFGLEVGTDPKLIKTITQAVKENVSIPVFVKLSPNVTDIVTLALAAETAEADAIVAINTIKAMKIDIEFQQPVLSNKIGGYSGKGIKPIAIRCVYDIAKHINIPIIGVGGIQTGTDVIEFLMAGASAVQIGVGIYYRELDIFQKIQQELTEWMNNHNIQTINELIGVAHK
ncbi:MAG: dihydroorotate dehydrogenase [Thermoplasmatota archaeon]